MVDEDKPTLTIGRCSRQNPPPAEIRSMQDWYEVVGRHSSMDVHAGGLVAELLERKPQPLHVIRLADD